MSAYDALQAYVPSLSKRVLFTRYPSCPWQERTALAARQFGAINLLLTIVRLHAGICIHSYGAYNVGACAAAILLVHYVSERMMGSIRGSALSAAEVAAFVTFVWMMVQREKYVRKLLPLCIVHARTFVLIETRTKLATCLGRRPSSASHAGRTVLPGSALCWRGIAEMEKGETRLAVNVKYSPLDRIDRKTSGGPVSYSELDKTNIQEYRLQTIISYAFFLTFMLIWIVFGCKYCFSPSTPLSLPYPLCLNPPNGVC